MISGSHSQLIMYWRFVIVRSATNPKASVFDELGMRFKNQLTDKSFKLVKTAGKSTNKVQD